MHVDIHGQDIRPERQSRTHKYASCFLTLASCTLLGSEDMETHWTWTTSGRENGRLERRVELQQKTRNRSK